MSRHYPRLKLEHNTFYPGHLTMWDSWHDYNVEKELHECAQDPTYRIHGRVITGPWSQTYLSAGPAQLQVEVKANVWEPATSYVARLKKELTSSESHHTPDEAQEQKSEDKATDKE